MYIAAGWGAVLVGYLAGAMVFYSLIAAFAAPDPSSEKRQRRWWTWMV